MRVVFVGASSLTKATARLMLESDHEVVIIDKDEDIIEELNEELDCSFVHGDGSKPSVLEEIDPHSTDVLFCLSNDDRANIIAAVVARSMEFDRVVLRIEDLEWVSVCEQLKLENVMIPDKRISSELLAYAEGKTDKPEDAE